MKKLIIAALLFTVFISCKKNENNDNKFETEKRLLSTQENYDLACHLRDFSEKSLKV